MDRKWWQGVFWLQSGIKGQLAVGETYYILIIVTISLYTFVMFHWAKHSKRVTFLSFICLSNIPLYICTTLFMNRGVHLGALWWHRGMALGMGMGEGGPGGRGSMYTYDNALQQKWKQHCKAIMLQLKKNKLKKILRVKFSCKLYLSKPETKNWKSRLWDQNRE